MRKTKLSRREILKGLGAAGVGAMIPGSGLIGQSRSGEANPRRIDVHHHHQLPGAGTPGLGDWTPAVALEMMDKWGIETTIMSRPSGDAHGGDEKSRAMARSVNEFAAKIVRSNPKRWGFFATLPYPDAEGSLKELEYAFGTLKADGILLTSSIADKWPGDPAFKTVWQELNRRKVIMFIHPLVPACCRTLIPNGEASVERDFDTTRAVANLLYSGTLSQFPDIRYIINHSGAAVPGLAGRMKDRVPGQSTFGSWAPGKQLPNKDGRTATIPNGVFYELRKLYYEIGHGAYPPSIAAMVALAPSTQYLFGTDFPAEPIESTVDELPASKLSLEVLQALYRGNAERLWPRFKSS